MTYKEIVAALRLATVDRDEESLDRAVDEEAMALRDPSRRFTAAYRRQLRADAEELFAQDITERLDSGREPIEPWQALSYRRRFCVAWAISEILREKRGF